MFGFSMCGFHYTIFNLAAYFTMTSILLRLLMSSVCLTQIVAGMASNISTAEQAIDMRIGTWPDLHNKANPLPNTKQDKSAKSRITTGKYNAV